MSPGATVTPSMVTARPTAATRTRSFPVRMNLAADQIGYPIAPATATSRQLPWMTVPAMPRNRATWVMMPPHTVQSVRPPLSIRITAPGGTSSRKSPTVPPRSSTGSYPTENAGPRAHFTALTTGVAARR